jgi:hypothetical protein
MTARSSLGLNGIGTGLLVTRCTGAFRSLKAFSATVAAHSLAALHVG